MGTVVVRNSVAKRVIGHTHASNQFFVYVWFGGNQCELSGIWINSR